MKSLWRMGAIWIALTTLACGGRQEGSTGGEVLVEVDAAEPRAPEESPVAQVYRARLEDDARLAFEIIHRHLESPSGPGAPMAAVYAMYLGLRVDQALLLKALRRGTQSDRLLVQTLSWRWLAAFPGDSLRGVGGQTPQSGDPVVGLWREVVIARGGLQDSLFAGAFSCPASSGKMGDSRARVKERLAELFTMTSPFDNGLLAQSLLLVESRRYGWRESAADGSSIASCDRIAVELIRQLGFSSDRRRSTVEQATHTANMARTSLLAQLENPLLGSPPSSLRGAAVSGAPHIRIAALRAMAYKARQPEVEDLGAAAAAMQADDPTVRLEAARTFLLLTARLGAEE